MTEIYFMDMIDGICQWINNIIDVLQIRDSMLRLLLYLLKEKFERRVYFQEVRLTSIE